MMTRDPIPFLLAVAGLFGAPAAIHAHDVYGLGTRVAVSVEIDGHEAPLYPAPDGSGRRYLEAREGASYAVRLDNRSGERLGVVLTVDGLNVISGVQATPYSWAGRMYVLGPWDSTTVRGWRTSLSEIRRFTFVDERSSYAARSGKANGKMGWIETQVYRERRAVVRWPWEPRVRGDARPGDASRDGAGSAAAPAPEPAEDAARERQPEAKSAGRAPLAQSYPGTGWGHPSDDPAEVVSFDPESRPIEGATLRYEYARALSALGIRPRPDWDRDRLRDRENGAWGYAQPPAW